MSTLPFSSERRQQLWTLLFSKSAVLNYERPYRKNTLYSVALVLLAAPFAVVVFPLLLIRVVVSGRIDLYELHVRGEFAWLVEHFERIRGSRLSGTPGFAVVVRSTFRHRGLAHLYRSQLQCVVLWSTGFSAWCAQILLLQPKFVIKRTILNSRNYFSLDMAVEPLAPTRRLLRLRQQTLRELGCSQSRYVTMAVFTSTREEQDDSEYLSKTFYRETIGSDLADSIDFLASNEVDVIMLGYPDSGRAHVPREIPRLSEFGEVGGLEEVALASGCLYFWSDYVGAQWLRKPFERLVLVTNVDCSLAGYKKYNLPQRELNLWISTLLLYETPKGHSLTLREILSMEPGYGSVARGELKVIRNSAGDQIAAHREMLSRANDTWVMDESVGVLQDRLDRIYRDFPDRHQLPISPSFLARHPHLLD